MRTLALRVPPCNIWHWRWKYLALGEMRVRNAITFTLCGASGDHEHKDEAINRCIYFGHHLDTPGHTWTHLSSLFSTARDHNHLALGTRWRGRGKKGRRQMALGGGDAAGEALVDGTPSAWHWAWHDRLGCHLKRKERYETLQKVIRENTTRLVNTNSTWN